MRSWWMLGCMAMDWLLDEQTLAIKRLASSARPESAKKLAALGFRVYEFSTSPSRDSWIWAVLKHKSLKWCFPLSVFHWRLSFVAANGLFEDVSLSRLIRHTRAPDISGSNCRLRYAKCLKSCWIGQKSLHLSHHIAALVFFRRRNIIPSNGRAY